jgi:filamentous hemagglutinin family protein
VNRYIYWVFLWGAPLAALPLNMKVELGEIEISIAENTLCIESKTPSSILHWEEFSIAAEEAVFFSLPNTDSLIVNRAIGSSPSSIFGSLSSNGRLVLINPAGVVFGMSSRIDAASLIATTLDLNEKLFMEKGELAFQGPSRAQLLHQGHIHVQNNVALASWNIDTSGSIQSDRSIALAASDHLFFDRESDRLQFNPSQKGDWAPPLAIVSGQLIAPGGEIHIFGDQIQICNHALLDASSLTRGGEILIGGNYKGQDSFITNAATVFLGPNTALRANALESGSGGKIIVWSETATQFHGKIEAMGGPLSGDGGFAEVSSRSNLSYRGHANLRSPNGTLGTLLLDPLNIIVALGGGATTADVDMFLVNPASTETVDPVVTLDGAGASIILQAQLDITFTDPIALSTAGASLTAQAGNNIFLDANIETTGGDIILLTGPFSGAPIPTATGSIGPTVPLAQTGILNTTLGGSTTGNIEIRAYNIEMNTGPFSCSIDSGTFTMEALQDITLRSSPFLLNGNTGIVEISALNDISMNAGIICAGAFAGTQISIIADADHDHVGTLTYFSVSGSSHSIATQGGGDIFLGGENVRMVGPNPGNAGNGAAQIFTSLGGEVNIQAFNDFSMTGHGGNGNSRTVINISGSLLVQAGHDISFFGGTSLGISGPAVVSATSAQFYAGNDILFQSGPSGGLPSPIIVAPFLSFSAGRDITALAGPIATADVSLTGSTLLTLYAARTIRTTNGALGTVNLNLTGGSVDMRAGSDIFLSSRLTTVGANFINVQADGPIPVLWPAQAGAFITGTPLQTAASVTPDGIGGFAIDTTPLAVGIAFTSNAGYIHLSSSDRFSDGTICSLTIGAIANANELTLTSISGDITVDPFFDIDVTNLVSTGGNIFMMAQHNISMSPTGQMIAGGSVELVTDNAFPTPNLIGPGAFLMDQAAFINYGGTLRIFTALRSQNIVSGLFNGANFVPGPLFSDSATEQWCTYYPFPALGTPHTIFYKDCLGPLVTQANLIISELLYDLNPWGIMPFQPPYLFEILYDQLTLPYLPKEKYWILRHYLRLINLPLAEVSREYNAI